MQYNKIIIIQTLDTHKLTGASVSQCRAAGHGAYSSVLTRLRLTNTESILTPAP